HTAPSGSRNKRLQCPRTIVRIRILGGITVHYSSIRALLMGLIIFALAAIQLPAQAWSQSGDGWTQLFDGKELGDWNLVGEANWRVEDGAIVADKRTSKDTAHLVSKNKYKDFMVYVEFWSSDDANSGVFLRCQDPTTITDRNCYEANIFDQRKDPTYGTGGVVNFAAVIPPM